jgi:serine/threonine protein kinase
VAGSEQAAIKLIEDDSFEFESALGKIKNEVDALKQLNNENIVKLLDANYEQGNLWIATEYIHGVTLDTKLKQTREPLKDLPWFRIAENIFHALEAAHAKGIIHKDIKPSNIILSESGAKLIDFGISHVPDKTRIANPGDFEGSRLFSAPENYNRKNIEEMDVFSAGVTLAYAAKLKSVWTGDNQDAITESIKNDKPDLSGLTPLQEEFIRPLLEKLPIDRPNSASVHKKALEYIEYLVDKEHKSKPVALRVKKTLSRRLGNPWIKWGVPVGLASAMALLVSAPWSSQQNITGAVVSESVSSSPNAGSTEEIPSPGPIVSYTPPSANSELQSKIVKAEEAYSDGDFETSLKF